jgi:hypothetical protein
MNQTRPTEMTSGDLELLTRIEELRSLLLSDQSVRERISRRAYELYERRGGEPSRDLEDWVQAENEILPPLIEEEIHRDARAAQTQTTQSTGINIENAVVKEASKSGVTKKRSAKSEEADSKTSKSVTKEEADTKGKGKKKKKKKPKSEKENK